MRRTELTDALYRALFQDWAAHGYAGLGMERIAERAGVSKATLYRRWKSKKAMAEQALNALAVPITAAPSSGTLAGDLRLLLRSFRRLLRHPLARRIIPDLQAEFARRGELREVLTRMTAARRARVRPLIEAAVARGELPATLDRELAADLVAAPIYWRMVSTGGKDDAAYVERLVRATIGALRASVAP